MQDVVRRSHLRGAFVLLLASGASFLAAAASAQPAARDPQRLVLRSADLPAAFRPYESRCISNAMARGYFGYTAGRENGYIVTFVKGKVRSPTASISSIAEVYRQPRDAHGAMQSFIRESRKMNNPRELAVGARLGDEARMYRETLGRYVHYVLGWRSGSVMATLVVSSAHGAVSARQAIGFAQGQQARKEAAG